MYNVGMISLGCEKNRVDAELMLGRIRGEKYNIVSNLEDADAVIVNTCGFIGPAKEESIDEILALIDAKKSEKSRLKHIIVTGCLAERYKRDLTSEIPGIDGLVGIGSNGKIKEILDEVFEDKKVSSFGRKDAMPLGGERVLTTPSYFAYLKIADGCDNFCSYCAIPMIRGRFRSRPKEDIINEAKRLVKSGVKEILLIAQDTTRYGQDLYGKIELPDLLNKLCEIDDLKWIRLMYCYPERITNELLDLIANQRKIVKYIDLPLQHCNSRILKLMNREGDRNQLENLIKKMRKKIPDLTLRTAFICGFPGETEEDFLELESFVRKIKFDKMGCFPYSMEEGTKAFNLPDQISDEIKEKRCIKLMKTQEKISENKGKDLVGTYIEVLVEGFDDKTMLYFGRSPSESPEVDGKVFFSTENQETFKSLSGEFVKVKINEYKDYNLVGVCELKN